MIAIEFEAHAHDGIVEIPTEYQAWRNKPVRVILLDPAEEKSSETKISFNAVSLKTKGYRFNRDEANGR